jgi:hypothetical protein
MMVEFEQIYRDIETLPKEAQTLVVDLIQLLKKSYSKSQAENESKEKSLYEKFDEIGLIGCCSVEDNLSTTYKKVLTDTLVTKYDHR